MKRSYRKLLALICAAATVVSMTACGNKSASASAQEATPAETSAQIAETAPKPTELSDKTLTVALQAEPTGLTGLLGAGTEAGLIVMDTLTNTLYRYDGETRQAVPALASSYETIDETHYRFTLREDACYSDGTPVKAQDVVYSFTKYIEAGVANATSLDAEGLVAEDDQHVVIAFKNYVPGWLYLVSEPSMGVFSEGAVEAVGGPEAAERTVPVSCGRYVFSEWKSGEYIMVERNDNYWDKDNMGFYKNIKFIFIGDSAARSLAVQSGDADVAYRVSATDYLAAEANPGISGYKIPGEAVYNVFFNCSSELMSNAKLREAVAYAIDANAVNNLITLGTGRLAQGLWSPSFPYMHDVYDGGVLQTDLEKSKAALAESGLTGFTLRCITLPANQGIATIVQENLRQVGIEVEVVPMEQSIYVQEARSGNYDMQIGSSTVETVQPNAFNQIDPAKIGISIGTCRITDPVMTELVAKASSSDEATSAEGFNGIVDYVFENFCLRGLCTESKSCVVRTGIQGLRASSRMGYLNVGNAYEAE